MNRRLFPFVAQTILIAFFLCSGMSHAQEAQLPGGDASAARNLIIKVTTELMNIVKNDPSIAKDIGRLSEIVDQKILPHTDMQYATQLVMGRHWRAATPDQREQLIKQFKDLVFYTYAGALSKVSTAQLKDQPPIEYKPLRARSADTDVVVETSVINEGKSIDIDYRLIKTLKGWKVCDVNVGGAWLTLAYQEQFDAKITENNQGIPGLLKFLSERNQQLKAGRRT